MTKTDNSFDYKVFHTVVSFDEETKKLRGKIEGIKDYVDFESDSIEKVENDFQIAVGKKCSKTIDNSHSPHSPLLLLDIKNAVCYIENRVS